MEQNKALVIGIVDRMKTVLDVRTDKDVAEALGASRSSPSVWKTRGAIPFNECIQLAVNKHISLDWLILGRGDMHAAEPVLGVETGKNLSEIPYCIDLNGWEMVEGQSWYLPAEWIESKGLKPGDLIAVQVQGDAMAPTLPSGQVVLVNRNGMYADEGMCVVEFGSHRRFRRVQHLADGSIRLSCDNPAYVSEIIPVADRDGLKIIGSCFSVLLPAQ